MKSRFVSLSLLLCCALPLGAQEATPAAPAQEAQKKGMAKLALIGVGPLAPRRFRKATSDELQEIKKLEQQLNKDQKAAGGQERQVKVEGSMDGIPMLMAPMPGEMPPAMLSYKSGKKSGADGKSKDVLKSIPVSFNNPSGGVEVPAGIPFELNRVVEREEETSVKRYVNCPSLEPGGQYAMFLVPTGKNETRWEPEPKQLLMRLDGKSFEGDQIMVLNFSVQQIKFLLGAEAAVLQPQGTKAFKVNGGGKLMRCAAQASNVKDFLINKAVPATSGLRSVYVFYDANPTTNGGSAVGVLVLDLPDTPTLPVQGTPAATPPVEAPATTGPSSVQ